MPRFVCNLCQREISYSENDEARFESMNWECDECYVIIGKRRYEVNQAGRNVCFSLMGMALGDKVMQSVIREQYAKDNPDENVIYLGYCDPVQVIKDYNPVKFWWANVTSIMTMPVHPSVKWFSMCGEASYYASQGIYPRLDFEPLRPQNFNVEKFVVLHIRHIAKAPNKNAEPFIVNRIIEILFDQWKKQEIEAVVLVGNDYQPPDIYLPPGLCIDLRNILLLPEIAWLCANARLTIGKDSGIVHLAAAAGGKMVSWGYVSKQWFPKCPTENYIALMADESHWDNVTDAVKKKGGFV